MSMNLRTPFSGTPFAADRAGGLTLPRPIDRASFKDEGPRRNGLLAVLPVQDLHLLTPDLDEIEIRSGTTLQKARKPVEYAIFLISGLATVLGSNSMSDRCLEIGMAGREGMVGLPCVLGTACSQHDTVMGIAGFGYRIDREALAQAISHSATLRRVLLSYVQVTLTQTAQSALAYGSLTIERRLARWILMCHDRIDGNALPVTHEFLAAMLGVRRAGVTMAMHCLEGEKLVRAERGRIIILDRPRLIALAGCSYGVPEAEYRDLLHPADADLAGQSSVPSR